MPLVYPRTPVDLVLLHVFLEILAPGILCVLLILVSHSFHCLYTPIKDLSEQGCLNIFIFVPSAPCLRPLCLSISILCVCVEIIIWEHAVQIKRKILPCSNCKGFETLPGSWCQLMPADRLVMTVQEWCQEAGDNQNLFWPTEPKSWSYCTGLSLPGVRRCCNLNFRTVSRDFLAHKCAEPLCWELCIFLVLGSRAAPFPLPIYWLNAALHITANEWFLHGWLLFYVNNWQHAPCLNPTGTCQVTFSLRFNI